MRATSETRAAGARRCARTSSSRHPDAGPGAGRRAARACRSRRSSRTSIRARAPACRRYSIGARLPRTAIGRRLWRALDPLLGARAGAAGAASSTRRGGGSGSAPLDARPRRDLARAGAGRRRSRSSSTRGRTGRPGDARRRAAAVGAAVRRRRAAAGRRGRSCSWRRRPSQDPSSALLRAALAGLADAARAGARRLEPARPRRTAIDVPRQRPPRRLGLLLAHDAALRRRRLPRRPRHARARAGQRLRRRRRAPPPAT